MEKKHENTEQWERPREYEFSLRNPEQFSVAHRVIVDYSYIWDFRHPEFFATSLGLCFVAVQLG